MDDYHYDQHYECSEAGGLRRDLVAANARVKALEATIKLLRRTCDEKRGLLEGMVAGAKIARGQLVALVEAGDALDEAYADVMEGDTTYAAPVFVRVGSIPHENWRKAKAARPKSDRGVEAAQSPGPVDEKGETP